MNNQQLNRVEKEALYCIAYNATVRQIAEVYGVSKTTVHRDLTKVLPSVNASMVDGVRAVLDKNLEERHIRGGLATKKKYSK